MAEAGGLQTLLDMAWFGGNYESIRCNFEYDMPFHKSKYKQRVATNNWLRKGFVGLGADEAWLKAVHGFPPPYVERVSLEKGFKVLSQYTGRANKLQVECLNCGRVYFTSFDSILKTTSRCCSKCMGKSRHDYYDYQKVVSKLQEHGFELLVSEQDYMGVRVARDESGRLGVDIHYPIRCLSCGAEYPSVLRTRMRGVPCRYCGKFHGHSQAEFAIAEFIRANFPSLQLVTGSRSVIPPYELDIYIPELHLAFEYNGKYWHSDSLIQKRTRGKFDSADAYHYAKTQLCKEADVQLVHLFETDGLDSCLSQVMHEIQSKL